MGAMLSDFRTLGFVRVSTFELVNPYLVRSSRRSAGMAARGMVNYAVEFCDGGGGVPPGWSLGAGCDLLGPEVDDDNIGIPFVLPDAPANVGRRR